MPFARALYGLLARPLMRHLPEGAGMVAIDVASPFLAPFKLTLIVALVVALPFVIYKLWAFVAPALSRHEQGLARPLLVLPVSLFIAGFAFASFAGFPLPFPFFPPLAPEAVRVLT